MSLTLFPLEFMFAVSFVFALFLWVCFWDYGSGFVFLCFGMGTHNGLRLSGIFWWLRVGRISRDWVLFTYGLGICIPIYIARIPE